MYKNKLKDCIIDEDWEKTPDMGEYLDNDMISELADKISNGKPEGEYFIEAPFSLELGYHQAENVFVVSAEPDFITDGDTIRVKHSNIKDGDKGFVFIGDGVSYKNYKDFLYQTSDVTSTNAEITYRLLGINAPEVPHCQVTYLSNDTKKVYAKYGEFKDINVTLYENKGCTNVYKNAVPREHCSFVYYNYENVNAENYQDVTLDFKSLRSADDVIEFVMMPGKDDKGNYVDFYYEIVKEDASTEIESGIDLPECVFCISHTPTGHEDDEQYHKQALECTHTIKELIQKASDIIYVVDGTAFKHQKNNLPFEYLSESDKLSSDPFYAFQVYYDLLSGKEKSYTRLGYRYFGQDFNQRSLATMYVKYHDDEYGEIWINVEKYLAFLYDSVVTLPAYTSSPSNISNFDYNSDAFKLWSYDKDKRVYIDAYNDFHSEMGGDDRAKIQKEITGCDLTQLQDYTVMIGDCLLIVPPTSIRLVSQTTSQRTSLIRAKGAITKTIPKAERIIEMQLYFNGEDGINGIPYEQKMPNGETEKYYMNGLRALVAQFKFTPYLPITNTYLNQILNIEAVSLNSIQLSTVPNFPKTIQATIRLQDFDYRQFMPEILPPDIDNNEDIYTNLFASVIHFPVMRYYYQKAIQKGEDVADLTFNSDPYLEATLGQKTVLQPMKFESPLIDFYIANEEHLKQRKELKTALEKKPFETVVTYTDQEKEFLKQVANLYPYVYQHLNGSSAEDALNDAYTSDTDYFTPTHNDAQVTIHDIPYDTFKSLSFGYVGAGTDQKVGFYIGDDKPNKTNDSYLDPMYNALKGIFSEDIDSTIISGYNSIYREYKKTDTVKEIFFGIKIKINWTKGGPNLLSKVKQDYGKAFAIDTDILLIDDCIAVGFMTTIESKDSSDYKFDLSDRIQPVSYQSRSSNIDYMNADISFLCKLANDFSIVVDKDGNVVDDDSIKDNDLFSQNQELAEMKDNIDLETDKSMVFDLYPIGKPIIESISIVYNNNFAKMSLLSIDGYASQYIGASDTVIEINMKTKDEHTVNCLQQMPRACAERLINYRKIMTCSPLRIDCELSRMFGINEVIIDSLDINTVPNYPGTYDISMRLISVDRTLRNREALKKLDVDTSKYNNDAALQNRNYFDLQRMLAQVELYPDLELPTIAELERKGYYFIRYKNQENRIFPDADFYFVYLHAYTSEMLRESIVKFFNNSDNYNMTHKLYDDLVGDNKTYNINMNPDDDDKSIFKLAENDEITSDAVTKLYEDVDKAMASMGSSATSSTMQDIKQKDDENNDRAKLILTLQENLDSFDYSTYDFNHQIKIAVKDAVPFNQYGTMINDGDIKVIDPETYEESEEHVDDIVTSFNDSVKALIKKILMKPISQDKATQTKYLTDGITELVNYIFKDIMQGDATRYLIDSDGNITTNKDDENGGVYTVQDQDGIRNGLYTFIVDKVRVAMSSALSGDSSILDFYGKENENKGKWIGSSLIDNVDDEGNTESTKNVLVLNNGQGMSDYTLIGDDDNIYEDGVVYGPFAIKKYDAKYLGLIYNSEFSNSSKGFMDPYYNEYVYKSFFKDDIENGTADDWDDDRITDYVDGISSSEWNNTRSLAEDNGGTVYYSTIAAFRLMLVWLYKLIDEDQSFLPTSLFVIRNLSTITEDKNDTYKVDKLTSSSVGRFCKKLENKVGDLFSSLGSKSDNEKQEAEIKKEQEEIALQTDEELSKMIEDIKKTSDENKINLICGLFTMLGALEVGEMDTPFYTAIKSGSLGDITSYLEYIKSSYLSYEDLSETDGRMRRYISYLDYDEYSHNNNWRTYVNPLRKYSTAGKNERVYLKAANIPSVYLLHSFYDMVMHDMRGRMARAFPTYYMLLIDEGRDLGMWHLQDNFYDVSSISEFQVVRSRKIAADTASIVMTNLFGTYTSEDEDMKDEYVYTFKDAWNSIFSPYDYYSKEYNRRKNAREFNRAKLKPGARVHLRMGYEADASRLPIMFNGCVAEVNTENDMINIICQGDGIELTNQDMFNPADVNDVQDLKYNSDMLGGLYGMFDNESTPRDLLTIPLTATGTWIQELIKNWSNSRFFNSNPFGIVHFGDKHYNEIFTDGEMIQNIYEALNKPTWDTDGKSSFNESSWEMETPPKIKVGTSNKSYWDLMNIAASVSPEFICSVAPFNLRSTIFYGAPRYYYAYDYQKTTSGKIVEKRKPYQQYHIFTSYTDILANKITASDKDVRTCAVGVYTAPGVLKSTKKTVGPMWIDIDIYPEKQKMTTINCDFEYRNTNLPFTIPVFDDVADNWTSSSYKIAFRATASGLRNTVKDMYTGELITVGDPSVKPYDKFMIYDTYNDIEGMADIEAVVQTFSIETGFTTSITPDCVSAIDDKYEKISHTTFKDVVQPAIVGSVTTITLAALYAKQTRAMFLATAQAAKCGLTYAESFINSMKSIVSEDEITAFSSYGDKILGELSYAFSATPTDYAIYNSIKSISSAYSKLSLTHSLKSSKDVSKLLVDLKNQKNILSSLNPDSLIAELNNAKNTTSNIKADAKQKIDDALEEMEKYKKAYGSANITADSVYIDSNEINAIIDAAKKNPKAAEEISETLSYLDKIKDAKLTANSANFTEAVNNLAIAANYIDDLSGETAESEAVLKALGEIDTRNFKKTAESLEAFGDIENKLKDVNTVSKGANAVKSTIASNLLWIGAQIVMSKCASEYIERKLKNLQVLTVFPLIKNDLVWTAGLDGNKGSVYDSPTYSTPGFLEDMAINFFDGKYGSFLPFLMSCFVDTTGMKEIVDGYRRDSQYDFESASSNQQATLNSLFTQMAKEEVTGIDAYRKLFLTPRIVDNTSNEFKKAYVDNSLVDIDDIESDDTISENLIYIFSDQYLKRLNSPDDKDKQVLFFAAQKEDSTFESDNSSIEFCDVSIKSNVAGEDDTVVKAKKITTNDDNVIYDIPYLRDDASKVLRRIVSAVVEELQPDATSDNSTLDELHKHNIIIHNCTRINEKNSWFSTGYCFTIQVKDYDNFGNILKKEYDNEKTIVNSKGEKAKLWEYKKDSTMGDNTYRIAVRIAE